MSKIYKKIKTESINVTFKNYTESLDIPQIDYFAVGIQNIKLQTSMSLMSSSDWQKYFLENNLAAHDPLRKAVFNTKRKIIFFDEIDFTDSLGKEIMLKRSQMGIKNGVVLMERFKDINYMITLGTGFSTFDSFEFIKRYHDKLNVIKGDFIKLIENEAKKFIASEHLSSDAILPAQPRINEHHK